MGGRWCRGDPSSKSFRDLCVTPLLATGTASILVGQVLSAVAPPIELAMVQHILVGPGDALFWLAAPCRAVAYLCGRRCDPQASRHVGAASEPNRILVARFYSVTWRRFQLSGWGFPPLTVGLGYSRADVPAVLGVVWAVIIVWPGKPSL